MPKTKQTNRNCASCSTKLTFFTKPNFGGGKLNDGGRVCRKCFAKLAKYDIGFGMNSKKDYSSKKVIEILNSANPKKIKVSEVFKLSSKSKAENHTELTLELDSDKLMPFFEQQQAERRAEIKSFNYNSNQIQRQGIQLLESFNIIDNTKNIDTLKSRFEFVQKLYDNFVKASFNKRYISDIQNAIDEYKSMYYDKILNDYEISLILKPEHDKLSAFYGESLMKCFYKYLGKQNSQIAELKRQDAIEKRLEKILDVVRETNSELLTNGKRTENFDEYKAALKKIRDETFKKRYKNVG
tara:strand:- start:890 stop:1780 length:891 start_codon:yes stop_codon:yes gene_type:complete